MRLVRLLHPEHLRLLDNQLLSIEGLIGSAFNDVLTGDSSDNHLWGSAGSDTPKGVGGNDVLEGGAGNDTYVFGHGDGPDNIVNGVVGNAGATGVLFCWPVCDVTATDTRGYVAVRPLRHNLPVKCGSSRLS